MKKGTILFILGLLFIIISAWYLNYKKTEIRPDVTNRPHPLLNPSLIVDLVSHDNDYIAEKCIVNGFNQANSYSFYHAHPDGSSEIIYTTGNHPNSLVYGFSTNAYYYDFISQLNVLNPKKLSLSESDSLYNTRDQFILNGCVFIYYGYKADDKLFIIVAIKENNVLQFGKAQLEAQKLSDKRQMEIQILAKKRLLDSTTNYQHLNDSILFVKHFHDSMVHLDEMFAQGGEAIVTAKEGYVYSNPSLEGYVEYSLAKKTRITIKDAEKSSVKFETYHNGKVLYSGWIAKYQITLVK